MNRLLVTAALCATAAPAMAQDAPIYGPCTNRFPAPEEFGTGGDFSTALEAQGWVLQVSEAERLTAAVPLAEVAALVLLSDPFADPEAALDFANQAMTRYERQMQFLEIYTRDGMSVSLSATELDPGYVTVRCTFAGPEVPSVKDLLDEGTVSGEGSAALVRVIGQDTPDGVINFGVVVFQFQGDDTTLAPITGREGIQSTFVYRVPE